MRIRHLLLVSVALGVVMPTAFGDDKPSPKEPTIEEDMARLVGEWELKRKDPDDPKAKETTYKVRFDKGGGGRILETYENGFISHGFNWAVTEVKGRGRAIVLLGNGVSSSAVQYDLVKEKDDGDRLYGWTGTWDSKIILAGQWRKLAPERK